MTIQLVPLRFPIGWTIEWNVFTDVSPDEFINEEHEHRWEYNEDMFQLVNYRQKKILDLGWYPEFQPNGQYRLVLIQQYDDNEDDQTNSWDNPIIKFETRSISDVIVKIEELLDQVSKGTI